jgi:hypothetical protein
VSLVQIETDEEVNLFVRDSGDRSIGFQLEGNRGFWFKPWGGGGSRVSAKV